jgi:hypothetical protein
MTGISFYFVESDDHFQLSEAGVLPAKIKAAKITRQHYQPYYS